MSHRESLGSVENDIYSSDKVTKLRTLHGTKRGTDTDYELHALSASTARDKHSRKSRANGRPNKHNTRDVYEHNGSNGVDGQDSIHTRTEMTPLQLHNTITAKKQSRLAMQTKSSIQHSKRKVKEDLDEILRRRLEKLEAELSVIGLEHSIRDADKFVEDITEETEPGDGKGLSSGNLRAAKKRKKRDKSDGDNGKFVKRFRTSNDESARIISANINGSMISSPDAKLDKHISTFLKNEGNASEVLSSMSADFSDAITSVIQSQFGMIQSHFSEQSENDEFGQLFSSAAVEQLIDTEIIMFNVLSENLPDTCSSHPEASTKNTSKLSETVDHNMTNMPCETLQPTLESEGIGCDLERHEESKHVGCLSVDTQWDSQFVDSFAVKSTHLNTVRDWRSKKLLDLLISGRLKETPVTTSLDVRHEATDVLVASSLDTVLSSLSWLWSIAVGDNMFDSVQDVVSNLDFLMTDFVEHSACAEGPVSVHLSTDLTVDDVTDTEVAAKQEISKQGDWSHVESLLLDGLATNLDDAREKVLNQKHAMCENTDVCGDLYSPTRPTEIDVALSGRDSAILGKNGESQVETGNKLLLLQSADVSDTLSSLVENSAPTRRTVRIHKKENVTAKSSSDSITGTVHKGRHGNSSSKVRGLPVSEEGLGNISSERSGTGFADGKPVGDMRRQSNLPVYEELLKSQSVEMSNVTAIEVAADALPTTQTFPDKQAHGTRHISDVANEYDFSVENQDEMLSFIAPVGSHTAKSSKKYPIGHDEVSGKSWSYHTDEKKDTRSRKHKEHVVEVTSKKNRKKILDIVRQVDRQLKLNVRSELNHVQKIIESLLYDRYGTSMENTSKISRDISLHVEKHFPILSGIPFDAKWSLMTSETEADAMSLTTLLNDILTEVNIPLSLINLTLPANSTASLTDRLGGEKLSAELSSAKKSQVESPRSPPTMRRNTVKQASVSRRNRSSQDAGVSIIPHRRQEAAVSENETRLMKADKLMQTFRRSQIAKRQSQRSSPQPASSFIRQVQTVTPPEGLKQRSSPQPASSFIRQVQTVTPSEGLKPASSDTSAVLSSELKEPDFSTVITDGSMLALVELPHILPKTLPSESDVVTAVVPQLPLAAEAVHISVASVPSSETFVISSVSDKTGSVGSSAGREQRVYVFHSDKPLCRQVQVCIDCVSLYCLPHPVGRVSRG